MKARILSIILCFSLVSCHTSREILYVQDINIERPELVQAGMNITVQPGDMISIIVSSKDVQLAALFNLSKVSYLVGDMNLAKSNDGQISGYTIDDYGYIDFPVIGKLYIAGLTKKQVEVLVKEKLIQENLIKELVVTVEFMNLHISVLGEVNHPGKFMISKDKVSLFEAISMAGDLTIYGKRDAVLVIREENGERIAYSVNLCTKNMFKSPAYYLKQNDVVYIRPNKVRAGQSTINANSAKSVSLWISISSFLASLGMLIFK